MTAPEAGQGREVDGLASHRMRRCAESREGHDFAPDGSCRSCGLTVKDGGDEVGQGREVEGLTLDQQEEPLAVEPVVLDLEDRVFDGQSLPDALREYRHVHAATGVCVKNDSGPLCERRPRQDREVEGLAPLADASHSARACCSLRARMEALAHSGLTGYDLTPTVSGREDSTWWYSYLRSVDEGWRSRLRAALRGEGA